MIIPTLISRVQVNTWDGVLKEFMTDSTKYSNSIQDTIIQRSDHQLPY